MKKSFAAAAIVVVLAFALNAATRTPASQQSKNARDMFAAKRQPGAKVRVELVRGNAPAQFVLPDFEFRTGDQIRFHFETNYDGYVTIVNRGPSGNMNLLFPNSAASNNRITPSADYVVPGEENWIEFKEPAGEETVIIVMSKTPLTSLAGAQTSPPAPTVTQLSPKMSPTPTPAPVHVPTPMPTPATAVVAAKPSTGESVGGQILSAAEEEAIIAAASRALGRTKSRSINLFKDKASPATYAVASGQNLPEAIAFSMKLTHK